MEDHPMRKASCYLNASCFVIAAALLLASAPSRAVEPLAPVQIREWPVPFGGHPRDPFAADSDTIWFVGQRGHYLARFTPSSGEFFKRDLADEPGPHNLIVGRDGIVWYAGNRKGYIGRYDPGADRIERIEMPDPAARDPHTMVFDAEQRHIWFTVQGGNFVGRLTVASRDVDLVPVPTSGARPYGVRVGPQGTVWVVLVGTHKLASIDPATLDITEHAIPAEDARPRRLEITADGRVWYADYRRGFLGRYDPAADAFHEWALPAGADARPYGMALDDAGRVWVVETGPAPNRLIGFDTRQERIVSITPIPSGGGSVRHMDHHAGTGTVWFGTDEGTLGRARVAVD
jgi:virginiamycin B lyase